MRSIFEKVERNHYLPKNTTGHGFNGFMDSNTDSSSYCKLPVYCEISHCDIEPGPRLWEASS